MVNSRKKFNKDLATGKKGEQTFYEELTKFNPNWQNKGDKDTDFRSVTEGVIELKTETSTSRKQAFIYKGQMLPRYQLFCVKYARLPKKNSAYPDKPPNIMRGVWKTVRDGNYWAEKVGNPNLKSLYVKQWIGQKCDHPRRPNIYHLKRLCVFFDPVTLRDVLEEGINNSYKDFAHNFQVFYNPESDLRGARIIETEKHGVVDFYHGRLCPDTTSQDYAEENTEECRVRMDMKVVFEKMEKRGHPITFDLETALGWLKN